MKKHVLFVGFLFFSCTVLAQNKTLGVGVASPNANAALHVESPTGNQGFILPRLTTTQRTAAGFTSVLGAADNGLMVYDTDLNTIFIWDGTKWKSSAQVAGGPKLIYPYVDTVSTAPNNSNLLRLIYAGSATENVGVAHFENLNPNSGFSSIFGRTNSATNGVADFIVNNPANNNDGLSVATNGLGTAARLSVNNASNQSAALHVSTNGTVGATAVNSAAILAETTSAFSAITAHIPVSASQSNAVSGITKSSDPGSWGGFFSAQTGTAVYGTTNSNVGGALAPVGVYGEARGTGSVGGAFWVQNATNNYPALYSNTIGIGPSLSVNVNNAANSAPALTAQTNGTGPSVHATTATGWTAIHGEAGGTGMGVFGRSTGSGSAISGETSTGWTAIHARQLGTAGTAGTFNIDNSASTHPAVNAATDGTGSAGNFQINNGSSNAPALFAQTNGTGAGISADNTNNGDAIFALKTGPTGSGGNFQINNGSNTAAALFAMTNAGGGSAIGAINSSNGNALTIFTGGVRVSVETVSSTTIANRAAAYRITGGGTVFTFGFGTSDGEVFMVFNDSGAGITVEGVAINNGEGKTIIRFASGVYRGL